MIVFLAIVAMRSNMCLFSVTLMDFNNDGGEFDEAGGTRMAIRNSNSTITNTINSRADQKEGKLVNLPYFVLHVGPGKSGTTTIQKDIPSMIKLLQQDNYSLIDHEIMHHSKNTITKDGNFSKKLIQQVKKRRELPGNQHIFGSSEYLYNPSPKQCRAWRDMFIMSPSPINVDSPDSNSSNNSRLVDADEKRKWNLQIIITYRRLHSYLPSVWNQQYKYFRINWDPQSLGHDNWPGVKGDIRIPSFEEWLMKEYKGQWIPHTARLTFNAWQKCSNEIKVVNIHQGHLMTNFICKGLKGADHTCSSLLQKNTGTNITTELDAAAVRRRLTLRNKSINLNYDILAVYAHSVGLVGAKGGDTQQHDNEHKHFNRRKVAEMIQEYVESNGVDLPQKCPNSTALAYLYKSSLKSEEWAFSAIEHQGRIDSTIARDAMGQIAEIEIKPLNDEQLAAFNVDWEQSLEDETFCVVDVVETIKQTKWREFFHKSFSPKKIE